MNTYSQKIIALTNKVSSRAVTFLSATTLVLKCSTDSSKHSQNGLKSFLSETGIALLIMFGFVGVVFVIDWALYRFSDQYRSDRINDYMTRHDGEDD